MKHVLLVKWPATEHEPMRVTQHDIVPGRVLFIGPEGRGGRPVPMFFNHLYVGTLVIRGPVVPEWTVCNGPSLEATLADSAPVAQGELGLEPDPDVTVNDWNRIRALADCMTALDLLDDTVDAMHHHSLWMVPGKARDLVSKARDALQAVLGNATYIAEETKPDAIDLSFHELREGEKPQTH